MHLVLDHSALIPCTHKPPEEKQAIATLGDKLVDLEVVWHVSTKYLKTLHNVLNREGRRCHPLPKLQRGLLRAFKQVLRLTRSKSRQCRVKPFTKNSRLKIHVVGGRASRIFEPRQYKQYKALLENVPELLGLTDDDREVIAIAFEASNMASKTVYVVATDSQLLYVVNRVLDVVDRLGDKTIKNLKKLKPVTPKQLLQELDIELQT